MSYCDLPRLVFTGQYQADVSTVNNDVRHYANASFDDRFQDDWQETPTGRIWNGWWNPAGTGAFRLVGCQATRAVTGPGAVTEIPEGTLFVEAQVERSAAKIVDLDPQFQMGSMLFGLRIVVSDGTRQLLVGDYRPSAFRDLYFGRAQGVQGSEGASAKFTSVLENLAWDESAAQMPVLAALKAHAEGHGGKLSINLVTTLFNKKAPFDGRLVGAIGPWTQGDPLSFVTGRRFAAVGGMFATGDGIGFFDAQVGDGSVTLDLGNALPFAEHSGKMADIGALTAAVLTTADTGNVTQKGAKLATGIAQGDEIGPDGFVDLGTVDYTDSDFTWRGAGMADFAIPDAASDLVADHPLALLSPVEGKADTWKVMIRETVAGLALRVDDFEARMDSTTHGAVTARRRAYATRWGRPLADLPLKMGLVPKGQSQFGGTDGGAGIDPPTATVPDIGDPSSAVTFTHPPATGADGRAELTLYATDPGNPQIYIDGQIYIVSYDADLDGTSPQPFTDLIAIHVRDPFEAIEEPDWDRDVAPFMTQYGNLYPIMSQRLFSLSDAGVAEERAYLLAFAFERPLEDPNHMPATRDLSEGKRRTILNWLAPYVPGAAKTALPAPAAAAMPAAPPEGRLRPLTRAQIDQALALVGDGDTGKDQAMRDYLMQRRAETAD